MYIHFFNNQKSVFLNHRQTSAKTDTKNTLVHKLTNVTYFLIHIYPYKKNYLRKKHAIKLFFNSLLDCV